MANGIPHERHWTTGGCGVNSSRSSGVFHDWLWVLAEPVWMCHRTLHCKGQDWSHPSLLSHLHPSYSERHTGDGRDRDRHCASVLPLGMCWEWGVASLRMHHTSDKGREPGWREELAIKGAGEVRTLALPDPFPASSHRCHPSFFWAGDEVTTVLRLRFRLVKRLRLLGLAGTRERRACLQRKSSYAMCCFCQTLDLVAMSTVTSKISRGKPECAPPSIQKNNLLPLHADKLFQLQTSVCKASLESELLKPEEVS